MGYFSRLVLCVFPLYTRLRGFILRRIEEELWWGFGADGGLVRVWFVLCCLLLKGERAGSRYVNGGYCVIVRNWLVAKSLRHCKLLFEEVIPVRSLFARHRL